MSARDRNKVLLRTAGGTCEIHVGSGVTARAGELAAGQGATKVLVVVDRRVRAAAVEVRRSVRRAGLPCELVEVTVSEAAKSLAGAERLYGKLLHGGLDRKSLVLAVGGGVVSDLAGFVAATFLRGIAWGAVPTTLLAQVDAAIGGKTAVNHPLGKNLVGAFHQPRFVLCDTKWLARLPRREWMSGLGEVVKYGLALDAKLFREVAVGHEALHAGGARLAAVIARCVALKARIVRADERETKGLRHLLNFGHTLGHAYEAATDYRHFRHGEAVLVGMRLAVRLSVRRGHLPATEGARVERFLETLAVPATPPVPWAKLWSYVARDKKASGGHVPFVLLSAVGRARLELGVTADDVRAVL